MKQLTENEFANQMQIGSLLSDIKNNIEDISDDVEKNETIEYLINELTKLKV